MIQVLKNLFLQSPQENAESTERTLRLAAAALLVETARADFTECDTEITKLSQLLTTALKLRQAEVDDLITAARERVEDATSLYEFTRVINDNCSPEQKVRLIGAMWTVAFADGDVDKYEEHLIRNVADLIYVPHSAYIHCKLTAQQ